MPRETGTYRISRTANEVVRAFVPHPLPPNRPKFQLDDKLTRLLSNAMSALDRLSVAGALIPSANWFLYGFTRKEALISSQIEGTQATLRDVLTFEVTQKADRPDDVEEVCNYVDALAYARGEISRPTGLPLSTRLLCRTHKRLMRGVRGSDKQPGEIRASQNWIGGSRPGNARFVPPPPDDVPRAMSKLEQWIHQDDPLPPLIRVGLAHVQFETIHPFLDGNGRVGRLLITLLVEHWRLLSSPLLYLSLAFRRRQDEYYERLSAVRTGGDWEGWTAFFLECVQESADDGVRASQRLFATLTEDRQTLVALPGVTIPAIRLFDELPKHPILTLSLAMKLLQTTKPTALKAIEALRKADILREITGRRRDRVYAYQHYVEILTEDAE
ncbi:MAG TPA: Fic/DOC family N-terminal domain-containing protein [Planctomycetaceae bacterium]|nr:Fic/DOC family N-terminal domain-containing protein [Planctomycetaceae bacterium]